MPLPHALTLIEYNVENLFLYMDQIPLVAPDDLSEKQWQALSKSTKTNKPLYHTKGIARLLQFFGADIVMLTEVGGRESLENFNTYFLNDAYIPLTLEGNSDRGIDLAYLVRRSLKLKCEVRTHRNRSLNFFYPHERQSLEAGYTVHSGRRIEPHKFSRDVLELRVADEITNQLHMVFLLVHLKSKWDRDDIDPFGFDRRSAELKTLIDIYLEIQKETEVPVIIGGDFNGNAAWPAPDEEFRDLYARTDLKDCLELAQTAPTERYTYVHTYSTSRNRFSQLDYIFIPQPLHHHVDAEHTLVYRYKNALGRPLEPPQSPSDRLILPSDHYPVLCRLSGLAP